MRLWHAALLTLAFILIPFFLWEDAILGWTNTLVASNTARTTLAAILAALLAADLILPVPSSLVSTAAGALLGFFPGTLTSLAGMTIGCVGGYLLGSRSPAHRWIDAGELDRLRAAQSRYGDWLLIVFRAVPVLAEASVFFAGLSRTPFPRFLALTTLSNLGISAAYAAAGAFSARRETFLFAFAGAIAAPGIAILLTRRR